VLAKSEEAGQPRESRPGFGKQSKAVHTVERILEVHFEKHFVCCPGVAFGPLPSGVNSCLAPQFDADSNLQRPEILIGIIPRCVTEHFANQAPNGFTDRDGPDAARFLREGVEPGPAQVRRHNCGSFPFGKQLAWANQVGGDLVPVGCGQCFLDVVGSEPGRSRSRGSRERLQGTNDSFTREFWHRSWPGRAKPTDVRHCALRVMGGQLLEGGL
jgi:hypothetical protein